MSIIGCLTSLTSIKKSGEKITFSYTVHRQGQQKVTTGSSGASWLTIITKLSAYYESFFVVSGGYGSKNSKHHCWHWGERNRSWRWQQQHFSGVWTGNFSDECCSNVPAYFTSTFCAPARTNYIHSLCSCSLRLCLLIYLHNVDKITVTSCESRTLRSLHRHGTSASPGLLTGQKRRLKTCCW